MCCHKAGGILTWIYGRGSRMAPYELCCIAHHQKAGGERERERGQSLRNSSTTTNLAMHMIFFHSYTCNIMH